MENVEKQEALKSKNTTINGVTVNDPELLGIITSIEVVKNLEVEKVGETLKERDRIDDKPSRLYYTMDLRAGLGRRFGSGALMQSHSGPDDTPIWGEVAPPEKAKKYIGREDSNVTGYVVKLNRKYVVDNLKTENDTDQMSFVTFPGQLFEKVLRAKLEDNKLLTKAESKSRPSTLKERREKEKAKRNKKATINSTIDDEDDQDDDDNNEEEIVVKKKSGNKAK